MIARMLALYVILAAALGSAAQAGPRADVLPLLPGQDWSQVWGDEFEGATLDRSKWNLVPEGARRDGWWDDDAVSVAGGSMRIKAWKLDDGRYASGGVKTEGIASFGGAGKTIYVSCRVALAKSYGHWPSCWMMPRTIYTADMQVLGTGRDWSEIDIFEAFKWPGYVNHAIHYDGYGKTHQKLGKQVPIADRDKFHTFGLMWSPDRYRFYVDAVMTWETDFGGVSQSPLHLLLTDEIARLGAWNDKGTMRGIDQATLPDTSYFDHVRVYEAVPAAGPE